MAKFSLLILLAVVGVALSNPGKCVAETYWEWLTQSITDVRLWDFA